MKDRKMQDLISYNVFCLQHFRLFSSFFPPSHHHGLGLQGMGGRANVAAKTSLHDSSNIFNTTLGAPDAKINKVYNAWI